MAEEKKKITFGNIGNALKSVATDHITAVAGDVFDEERQKYQNEVNTDLETTDNEIKADLEAETARAKAAEEANATAIAEEKAAIMGTDRIADGAVTTEKLALSTGFHTLNNIGLFYSNFDKDEPAIEINYTLDNASDLTVTRKAGKFRIWSQRNIITNNLDSDEIIPFSAGSVVYSISSQAFLLLYDISENHAVILGHDVLGKLPSLYPNGFVVLGFGSLHKNGSRFLSIGNIKINGVTYTTQSNNTITTDRIADGAVTTEKLDDSAMSQAMTNAINNETQVRAKTDEQLNTAIECMGLFYLLIDSANPAIEITYSRSDVTDLVVRQKAGKFRIFGRNLTVNKNIDTDIDNPFTDNAGVYDISQGFMLVYDIQNERAVLRGYDIFLNKDIATEYPNGYIILGFGSLINNGQSFYSIGDIKINGTIYKIKQENRYASYVDKENFEVEVICNNPLPSDYLSEDSSIQEPIIGHDRCVLVLPTTYTTRGTPTKLVLTAHGGGSEVKADSYPAAPAAMWKYLISLGYAVLECNGMPYDFANIYGLDVTRPVGNYIAVQSYKKAYDYVVNKYNIDKNGCFMCGWSQGGHVSLNIGDLSGIPIKAIGLEAPVVSMLKQWNIANSVTIGDVTYTRPARLNIAKLFGFIQLNTTPTNDEILALEFDESKVLGYDPYTRNVIDAYMSNEEPTDIAELSTKKFNKVPFKIWIAKDDGVMTPSALHQRIIVNAVKKTGGVADIHLYPNSSTNTNSHMLHDVQTAIGTFDYKGTQTNLMPFVYEMAQWFESFGGINVQNYN